MKPLGQWKWNPPGPVLFEGFVQGHPKCWTAAVIGRNKGCIPNVPLKDWQATIRHHVLTFSEVKNYAGPVSLSLVFAIKRSSNGNMPDLTNLVKAAEDAIKSIKPRGQAKAKQAKAKQAKTLGVFVPGLLKDDNQVCMFHGVARICVTQPELEGVYIQVCGLEGNAMWRH